MARRIDRKLALGEELLTSIRLISAGLGQLQALDGTDDFYHLPILSLANGFERFMKVALCFSELEKTGAYPSSNFIPTGSKGHDLELLLGRVTAECFRERYVSEIPAAKHDLEYLGSQELRRFIRILSNFGQKARYHDLNIVIGKNDSTESPKNEWQSLEIEIILANDWLENSVTGSGTTDVRRKVNREVIIRLERFARAIARLFTIGRLGSEAKSYTGYLKTFLFLMDSDLGERTYSPTGVLN